MSVTDICLSTKYFDLFAVCFGSFDLKKQDSEGWVCLFSIKNPIHPEIKSKMKALELFSRASNLIFVPFKLAVKTKSAVMCCDFHVNFPDLLVIGQFDGNVSVYNLIAGTKDPILDSIDLSGKHSDSVTEIQWGDDMHFGEKNFYSSSLDGRVLNWVLTQCGLTLRTVATLYLDVPPVISSDGLPTKLKADATCMTFHPNDKEIFLVGTEEGSILKCTTTYSSKYLMTYQAHYLSVQRVDFNKYKPDIFLSCSGDNRVKIWEDMRSDALAVFDLGAG
jgi:dynein intermediate chain 1, axonemal